jgi:hypothetical protein
MPAQAAICGPIAAVAAKPWLAGCFRTERRSPQGYRKLSAEDTTTGKAGPQPATTFLPGAISATTISSGPKVLVVSAPGVVGWK